MASRKQVVDLNAQAIAQRAEQMRQGGIPNLGPGVTDPRAVGYAAGAHARRGGLPKYTEAVAGGDPPPIPALEQPYQAGLTMAQQAESTRRGDSARRMQEAMRRNAGSGSIIAPDVQQAAPAAPDQVASPRDMNLLPQDMLPDEATKDPAFVSGAGSRMAMSQPQLAAKYGVVRGGKLIPPQALVQGAQGGPPSDFRRQMRSKDAITADLKTALSAPQVNQPRQLDGVESNIEPPKGLPRTDAEARQQAQAGPGGAAANAGPMPIAPILDSEVQDQLGLSTEDLASLQREMIRDILRNPKQKEIVEARCKPLNIEELILRNKVTQRVPIIPQKFEPTFESMEGTVELALKRMLYKESEAIAVTEAYLLQKYALMTTAAGLVAINGAPTPSMYNDTGVFDEKLYWEKFNWVARRSIHMLASLGIHYSWFEERVRLLFKVDEGKDG